VSFFVTIFMVFMSIFFPPAPAGGEGCDQYTMLFTYYEMPLERSVAICYRESRGFSHVINSDDPNGGSFGLMQINAIHLRDIEVRPHLWDGVERCNVDTVDDLLIGWKNICVASHLYAHAGWEPWGG